MAMETAYAKREPTREEIDALAGPAVIEFGTPWCGFCVMAQPRLAAAFAGHPGILHLKIEDGRAHRLGRFYRVKLWPTLIFLDNGEEVARLVRPANAAQISEALKRIDG